MLLNKIKPISNSNRHKIKIKKNLLLKKNGLIKTLKNFVQRKNGRCPKFGHITVRHKGGGNKKLFRSLNEEKSAKKTISLGSFYDPNRTAFISLRFDIQKKKFLYNISLENEYPGTLLEQTRKNSELKLGYRNFLDKIPTGSIISQISSTKTNQIKYIKSAGTYGQIVNKTLEHCLVKMPSGKIKRFSIKNTATIGNISNTQHSLQVLGKAGSNRKKNKRPSVRGIAMNPVDHPHGGRTNGGKPSVSPWGLLCKGHFKLKKRK